jgi:glycosyltransferase involved in cell wall biosynthesis
LALTRKRRQCYREWTLLAIPPGQALAQEPLVARGELTPRHFSWRIRGNALYWSIAERSVLEAGYDLLVATSMVDLATLRGLVPALAAIPTVLYFHENQFEYPRGRQRHSPVEAQVTSLYSALAADRILFNSAYNRATFLAGCSALLEQLPDRVPPGVVTLLEDKSDILPVPIEDRAGRPPLARWPGADVAEGSGPLRLLWVGRLEHDKGGEGLRAILQRLEDRGLDYELAVTGQQFRDAPPVFEAIRRDYGHRIVQFGFIEDVGEYRGLLAAAQVVLSTAWHEFQGLAVLEAVSLGCQPVVPDRLAYAEIYPRACRYASRPEAPDEEARCAVELIADFVQALPAAGMEAPDVSAFERRKLAPRYERFLRQCQSSSSEHNMRAQCLWLCAA